MFLIGTLVILEGYALTARRTVRERMAAAGHDRGGVTLEWVMIVVGLIAVALIAVAAITSAVQSRVDKIG